MYLEGGFEPPLLSRAFTDFSKGVDAGPVPLNWAEIE